MNVFRICNMYVNILDLAILIACTSIIYLDFIKSSGSGRIIMVSSIVHKWTSSLPVLPVTRETCKAALLYCQTKLANVLFACELSRRLEGTGLLHF